VHAATALELRAEAFDLLNTPALGIQTPCWGQEISERITAAGDPRVVQLAVKLLF